jgi:hypothetical protein
LEQTDGNFGGSGLEPHARWSAKCTPRARRGGMPRAATIDKSAALILPISTNSGFLTPLQFAACLHLKHCDQIQGGFRLEEIPAVEIVSEMRQAAETVCNF